VEPSAWYAGMSGDLQLPESPATPGVNDSTDLGDLNQDSGSRLTPLGEINLRKGDWGITARGFVFSSDRTASGRAGQIGDVPISSGDTIASSVDMTSLDLELRYTILPWKDRRVLEGKARLRPRLDVMGGVRFFDTTWDVENRSLALPAAPFRTSQTSDEVSLHPTLGVKGSLEFYDRFSLDVQVSIGGIPMGDSASYSGDVLVGGTWKPHPNLGVQAGYRALFFSLSSGEGDQEYSFVGALQGLYVGVVLEF
jgi:hypothetical protein